MQRWVFNYLYNPALNAAVKNNSLDLVKKAVLSGADVNNTNNGDTPLIAAIKQKNNAIAEYLLEQGADPNEHADIAIPLDLAIQNDDIQLVSMLLRWGAHTYTYTYETPLIKAIERGNLEIINLLLNKGANAINNAGGNGYTPLSKAIAKNNPQIVARLLEVGADPNPKYDIPLIRAIKQDNLNLEIIDLLLIAGAKPNEGREHTPLNFAIIKNKPQIVAKLLEGGADPNLYAGGHLPQMREFPLLVAYTQGNEEIINLLLTHGADVNAESGLTDDEDWPSCTPLLRAIYDFYDENQPKAVDYVLNLGADPNKTNSRGNSPLPTAIYCCDDKTVELLLKKGANPNDPDGNLSLEVIEEGDISKLQLLLKYGAEIYGKNKNNKSVFEAYHQYRSKHIEQGQNDELIDLIIKNMRLDPSSRATRETTAIDNQQTLSNSSHSPKQPAPSVTSSFCSFPAAKESQAQPMELEQSVELKRYTSFDI